MRVVRFNVSCRPPSSPLPLPHPPPPDLNGKCRMAVFPAGPQPAAPDGSIPCQTSTASSGWQCSPLDFNRERWRAVFPAGPQPQVPGHSGHHRTSTHNTQQHNMTTKTQHTAATTNRQTTSTQSQAKDHKHNQIHTATSTQPTGDLGDR